MEANWFYSSLGIDDVFFARESAQGIASHIHSLYSCKVQAFASGINAQDKPLIRYKKEAEDHAVFLDTHIPGQPTGSEGFDVSIDDKYIDPSKDNKAYRLEFFSAPLNYKIDPILAGVSEKVSADPESAAAFAQQIVKCHFIYKVMKFFCYYYQLSKVFSR